MEFHVTPNATPVRLSSWLENAWLARYLDRQLSGDEIAWFEAYVLDKPELLDVIDADTRLRDALIAEPPARENSRRDSAVVRRPPSWLAMAAMLVVGVGIGWIGMRVLSGGSGSPEVIASPTRVIYDTMRGEATPPRVEHADSKSPYVLVEVAVPPGAEQIVLQVADASDRPLKPSPDGFVSFLLARKGASPTPAARVIYTLGKDNSVKKYISLNPM